MFNKQFVTNSLPELIILPYAGGSAQAFCKWSINLRDTAKVKTIEYPGHGTRFKSPLSNNFYDLIHDVREQTELILYTSEVPFWIFGHSMGGIIAAYIADILYKKFKYRLKGLIISSCLPPLQFANRNNLCTSDIDIIEYLCTVRNVPRQLVSSNEFKDYILPAIKNDFHILNDFPPLPLNVISCPVYCVWGSLDYGIRRTDMADWQLYAENQISWHSIEGTHFYFEEHEFETMELLKKIILAN